MSSDDEGEVEYDDLDNAATGARRRTRAKKQQSTAKKKNKKADKRKAKAVLDRVAKALDTNGWAVCDSFASVSKVRTVSERVSLLWLVALVASWCLLIGVVACSDILAVCVAHRELCFRRTQCAAT